MESLANEFFESSVNDLPRRIGFVVATALYRRLVKPAGETLVNHINKSWLEMEVYNPAGMIIRVNYK